MAKTRKRATRTRAVARAARHDEGGRQAPVQVASPAELLAAISAPSRSEKVALLKEIGILDKRGKLAQKYRSWGSRVSRTE